MIKIQFSALMRSEKMTSKHIVGGLKLWLKLYCSICLPLFIYNLFEE